MSRLSVLFLLLLLLSSCSNGTTSLGRDPSIDTLGPAPPRYDLENDMFLPNEGRMYSPDWDTEGGGIRGYDWYMGANFDYRTKEKQKSARGFDRIGAWGVVVASEERPTPNVDPATAGARVHIKEFRLYILRKDTQEWYEVLEQGQAVGIWGAMYFSNFKHNEWNHYEDSIRMERKDNNGRTAEISVTAGAGLEPGSPAFGKPGFLQHFWWSTHHPKIDPNNDIPPRENHNPSSNVDGIYIVCKARLTGNYTTDPRYLIQLGFDHWLSPDIIDSNHDGKIDEAEQAEIAEYDTFGTVNSIEDGAGGRFKYVTPEWQYFTLHTFSPEEVRNIKFPGEVDAQFYGEQ